MTNGGNWIQLLKSHRSILATVESCTGGLIADQLTDIAGISECFWGSWIVYDSTAKEALGVSKELILRHGSVSAEVAAALSEKGAAQLERILKTADPQLNSLISPWSSLIVISTTGIAGPSGGTATQPVGLCYCGVSVLNASGISTQTLKISAPAGLSRSENKEFFARQALEFARDRLK